MDCESIEMFKGKKKKKTRKNGICLLSWVDMRDVRYRIKDSTKIQFIIKEKSQKHNPSIMLRPSATGSFFWIKKKRTCSQINNTEDR